MTKREQDFLRNCIARAFYSGARVVTFAAAENRIAKIAELEKALDEISAELMKDAEESKCITAR